MEGLSRWPWWRRWFGRRSERAAARFLRRRGYRIIAANLTNSLGEIDLLALQGDTLVVIEVRSTAQPDPFRPLDSVDIRKQKKLTEVAIRFLQSRQLLGRINVRFDIVAVCWPPDAKEPTIHHVEHAFEAYGRFQMFY